jgi:circadian clock protein KaiB
LDSHRRSLPELFKGIALFTPGGDLVYCVDPLKKNQWHIHLCAALQELLDLPESPHFLVPCYTATIDRWRDPYTQQIRVSAEAYPLVMRHQALLNLLFTDRNLVWRSLPQTEGICDPMVLSTYRHQFPQLWEDHDLIVRFEQPSRLLSTDGATVVLPQESPLALPSIQPLVDQPPAISRSRMSSDIPKVLTQGYVLRLFVSGNSIATERTLQNLHQLLEQSLHHPYTLSVIDILKHPEQAETDQIFATPTLIRVWPQPVRRIVGEMDNVEVILRVLGA